MILRAGSRSDKDGRRTVGVVHGSSSCPGIYYNPSGLIAAIPLVFWARRGKFGEGLEPARKNQGKVDSSGVVKGQVRKKRGHQPSPSPNPLARSEATRVTIVTTTMSMKDVPAMRDEDVVVTNQDTGDHRYSYNCSCFLTYQYFPYRLM